MTNQEISPIRPRANRPTDNTLDLDFNDSKSFFNPKNSKNGMAGLFDSKCERETEKLGKGVDKFLKKLEVQSNRNGNEHRNIFVSLKKLNKYEVWLNDTNREITDLEVKNKRIDNKTFIESLNGTGMDGTINENQKTGGGVFVKVVSYFLVICAFVFFVVLIEGIVYDVLKPFLEPIFESLDWDEPPPV